MKRLYKGLVLSCAFAFLAGCGNKSNLPKPAPLETFIPKVKIQHLWSNSVSSGAGSSGSVLQLGVAQNRFFVTDYKGHLAAIERVSGKTLWNTSTGYNIMSGVGVSEAQDKLFVTTDQGYLVAFAAADGKKLWASELTTQSLSVPVSLGQTVYVKTIDGRLTAFNAETGAERWAYTEQAPALTLRGDSAPTIANDRIFSGFANGKLLALSPNGSVLWQTQVAWPQGQTAVQRMVDIHALPLASQNIVFAATYQGQLGAYNLSNGNVLWQHEISTYTGMDAYADALYLTDAASYVWSFARSNGHVDWVQKSLFARGISSPARANNVLLVGDKEGYLHALSLVDGSIIGREHVGGSIKAKPIVSDNNVYLLTLKGHIHAYQISQ